jgi:hypothetical protein
MGGEKGALVQAVVSVSPTLGEPGKDALAVCHAMQLQDANRC